MGGSEMIRFGMTQGDFKILAGFMADLIKGGAPIRDEIKRFRGRFLDMQYCFKEADADKLISDLKY